MKKQLITLIALAISSVAMAAITRSAVIKMTMTSQNNTIGDDLILVESDSYSTERDLGADIDKQMGVTTPAVNEFLYAFGSFSTTGKLSMLAIDNLEGVPLGIKGNTTDVQYTITFPNVTIIEGRDSLYLEDILLKKFTKIRPNDSYTFTIEDGQKGQEINDRFRISIPVPGEFKICTTFDHVEIYENTGSDNIVITKMAGDTVVNVAPVPVYQAIDLSGKPAGHYFLTVNGTQYEFFNKPEAK